MQLHSLIYSMKTLSYTEEQNKIQHNVAEKKEFYDSILKNCILIVYKSRKW